MKLFCIVILLSAWGGANAQSGVEELSSNEEPKAVQVFPNPAIDYVNIRFESPRAKAVSVVLHNIIGNEIDVDAELVDDHIIQLKIKDLPTGYYLITLRQNETSSRTILKFLKR
jgi:hypothetical protein